MKTQLISAFIILMLAAQSVLSDGIGFKSDRVQGHTTTVITLTKEQLVFLNAKPKKKDQSVLRSLPLTSEQKEVL